MKRLWIGFSMFGFCIFLTISASRAAVSGAEKRSLPHSNRQVERVKVRWGMTLDVLLRKAGLRPPLVGEIVTELRKVFDPRRLRAGDQLILYRSGAGDLQELSYRDSPERLVGVRRNHGRFVAYVDSLPTHSETTLVTGTVKTTLYDAVLAAGESPELIMAFSDIFQWDIDFFIDPRRGDRFYILVDKRYVRDPLQNAWRFVGYGPIQAAAYEKFDSMLMAFAFSDGAGPVRYYDAKGCSFQKTFLKSPLNYRRISSYFSLRRRHPILKRVRAHTGVDFAAPTGTPVVASADGRIVHIGRLGGYGNCIKISHKGGRYVTLYGHLSRYARGLRKGSPVRQGQVIGYVGATGLATGPHLHYTMYDNGRPINPLKIRPVAGKPVPENRMAEFTQRARWLAFQMGLLPAEQFADVVPLEGMAR